MKSDEVCACACACIPHICIQTYRHATHTYICAFALAGDMWQQKPCLRLTWPAVVVWLRSVRPSYRPPALRPSVSVWGIEAFNLIFVQVRFTYPLPFPPVPFALCVCVCVCGITCILSRCARLGVGTMVSSYSARLCWLHWTWAAARAATLLPGHTLRSNERASTHLN